jgi:hypothetical protein
MLKLSSWAKGKRKNLSLRYSFNYSLTLIKNDKLTRSGIQIADRVSIKIEERSCRNWSPLVYFIV